MKLDMTTDRVKMINVASFILSLASLFLAVFLARKQLVAEYKEIPFKGTIMALSISLAFFYLWDYSIDDFKPSLGLLEVWALLTISFVYLLCMIMIVATVYVFTSWPAGAIGIFLVGLLALHFVDITNDVSAGIVVIVNVPFYGCLLGVLIEMALDKIRGP